jgi:hypothetical protein
MKRTFETLASLALWALLCTLGAAVALGFCGYFD